MTTQTPTLDSIPNGQALREMRTQADITMRRLARQMGTSESHVSVTETSDTPPTPDFAERYLKALHVCISQLRLQQEPVLETCRQLLREEVLPSSRQ